MTGDWIERLTGSVPRDPALFERALTHGSTGQEDYQRLEFLGDRVLGLAVADMLYRRFVHEPEGRLSHRLNALVAGRVCAEVARDAGVADHVRLGKQARDDGARDSDNVLGDVMEALIGALYVDQGHDAARALVERLWRSRVAAEGEAPKHPKSALQEWAAANRRRAPEYAVTDKAGPPHATIFTVEVRIHGLPPVAASGSSKQDAESAAAAAFLKAHA